MARPLRIEYPDAWYHVMNRGRRAEHIFLEEIDYKSFVELLMESVELWNFRIAAYCLMPNHYHLVVQTPDANLSRCMRHINGIYTQRFNRSHRYDGQLFRGRYKSIVVDADNYLLQLVRYIHRNPIRSGIVERMDSYKWSSHRGYLSRGKKWDWLHKGFVLSMLSKNTKQQQRLYKEFMVEEDSEEISQVFEQNKLPSILGRDEFIDGLRDRFFERKTHKEVPQSRVLAPEREKIKQVICRIYGVRVEHLLKSKRGTFNEPRSVAIYLTRQLRGENLAEICREYGLSKYSSASSVIERMGTKMSTDRQLRKRVAKISQVLTKSQAET
jgi:REP element-mobilizing transposase RayT